MRNFAGKVVVITGAGSGIGQALAQQLAQMGAILALVDVNEGRLGETAVSLPTTTASQHIIDVTNRAQMNQLAQTVITQHGQIDGLINNAGVTLSPTFIDKISDEQFEWVIDINMWGVYNGVRAFLPYLRQRPEAFIVNVSSMAGLMGLAGYSPYVMSKFAIRGLSEALQMELAETNITVTSVHPGGVKTNIMKNAPNFQSDEQRQKAHNLFTKGATLTPNKAARKIIRAVQRKRYKLLIGVDMRLLNGIRWLFPNRFPQILAPIFNRMMFG